MFGAVCGTYNSASRCCRLTAGKLPIRENETGMDVAIGLGELPCYPVGMLTGMAILLVGECLSCGLETQHAGVRRVSR